MQESDSKKRPAPFSLRLTFEERSKLDKDAAGMSLAAYIRMRLFADDAAPRKVRNKFPVKDHKMLSNCLAILGQSRISNNLNQMTKLANMGALPVSEETEAELMKACKHIAEIRQCIFEALGLQDGGQ